MTVLQLIIQLKKCGDLAAEVQLFEPDRLYWVSCTNIAYDCDERKIQLHYDEV